MSKAESSASLNSGKNDDNEVEGKATDDELTSGEVGFPQALDVTIRAITADETIALRHQVLWPDQPVSFVRLPEDDAGRHFGAFIPTHQEPIAVISLFAAPLPDTPSPETALRFRKFACRPDLQRRGIGTLLLQHAIRAAQGEVLWCNARLATAPWYEKRGLVKFGPVTLLKGHEYTWMRTMPASS